MAKLIGAEIILDSQVGHGSRFTVIVPLGVNANQTTIGAITVSVPDGELVRS
jgi:hypothetical protein